MTDAAGIDTVQLVPHTHWDREWYEPFQRFRLRLVGLLDDVLGRADRDPNFCFTLDGQMAAVDDYLEVRPEQRPLLEKLVRRGQIAIGPWQILLDEFLCSGETIVRNLEMGWHAASALGGVMPVGYLPDEFGHCAQMPQILARAGLRHACLWRGVPASVDAHAFRWEAPDGTAVRTEYLVGGYGNAADIFSEREGLQRRYARLVERLRPWFPDAPILAMYGTDHAAPLPTLMGDVERINTGASDGLLPMHVTTLAAYVEARDPDEAGLDVVRGELRSHARANILPGVLSVRWQLKDLMARAERMVERYAEPMAALWAPEWPEGFLAMAWRRLVDSSCHDSVTGCGVDDTALQVAARIAEAEHLGQAVRDRVAAGLAVAVPSDAQLVLNPSPSPRSGLVTLDLPVPADWSEVSVELPGGERGPVQLVSHGEQVLGEETVAAADLADLWRRVHGRELFGREIRAIDYDASADSPAVTFHVGEPPHPTAFDPDVERDRLAEAGRRDQRAWRVRILDEARRTVHAQVAVPPLGWTAVRAVPGATPVQAAVSVSETAHVMLANPLLRVQVRPDGALRVEGVDGTVLDGVGRIVDGGDVGDTYNYGPPANDALVDAPVDVAVSVLERGPLRGAVEIRRGYRWPLDTDPVTGRTAGPDGTVHVEVVTRVELRAGEPFCRLDVSFDNRCRDHRVRLHVPTARPAAVSHAEGQYAVVERGQQPEGGSSGEVPIPTYPAYGFVDAGGAGLLLTRATEYELVDGGEVAITLLRGAARISRNVHPLRDEPAGPQVPTPDAQCPGLVTAQLAVLPHAGDWHDAGLVDAAERFRLPLVAVRGAGETGAELSSAEGLSVAGAGVAMTSLRHREDWLELRLVAETPSATSATISGGISAARRCDLLGRPGADLEVSDGSLELDLRPWEIATVQLRRGRRGA